MLNIRKLFDRTKFLDAVQLINSNFVPTRHVNKISLKPRPYNPPKAMDYDERNMKINRPMSPHLTIYAVELPSTLSITHRLTGAALSGYVIVLGLETWILPCQFDYYIDLIDDLHIGIIPVTICRFILAFPLCFHFCNGIRHLIWDTGMFLKMNQVYFTAYVMLTCTFASTAYLCVM